MPTFFMLCQEPTGWGGGGETEPQTRKAPAGLPEPHRGLPAQVVEEGSYSELDLFDFTLLLGSLRCPLGLLGPTGVLTTSWFLWFLLRFHIFLGSACS